jgi:hypothetical protein
LKCGRLAEAAVPNQRSASNGSLIAPPSQEDAFSNKDCTVCARPNPYEFPLTHAFRPARRLRLRSCRLTFPSHFSFGANGI